MGSGRGPRPDGAIGTSRSTAVSELLRVVGFVVAVGVARWSDVSLCGFGDSVCCVVGFVRWVVVGLGVIRVYRGAARSVGW